MTAKRRGEQPRIPRPRATHVIVFRRGYQVFRRDQEPEQFRLLQALVGRPPARGRGAREHWFARGQRRSRRAAPQQVVRGMGQRPPLRKGDAPRLRKEAERHLYEE